MWWMSLRKVSTEQGEPHQLSRSISAHWVSKRPSLCRNDSVRLMGGEGAEACRQTLGRNPGSFTLWGSSRSPAPPRASTADWWWWAAMKCQKCKRKKTWRGFVWPIYKCYTEQTLWCGRTGAVPLLVVIYFLSMTLMTGVNDKILSSMTQQIEAAGGESAYILVLIRTGRLISQNINIIKCSAMLLHYLLGLWRVQPLPWLWVAGLIQTINSKFKCILKYLYTTEFKQLWK